MFIADLYSEQSSGKSDIIHFYNQTKGEVDFNFEKIYTASINQILEEPNNLADKLQERESEPKKRKYCTFCSYKKQGCQN